MPRLPEFDRAEVLNSALLVFISDGYEASSINKLLDAMGINRGSLYASFGDKETLFREVMSIYSEKMADLITPTLIEIQDPLLAIQTFFERLFYVGVAAESSKGCLLFNTVSELRNTNPALAEEASDHLRVVRELIHKRLKEAEKLGKLKPDQDIEAKADTLFGVIAGLRMLGKMGLEEGRMHNVIKSALNEVAA